MKAIRFLLIVSFALFASTNTYAGPKSSAPLPVSEREILKVEIDQLKSAVAAQGQQIAIQKELLHSYMKKKEESNTALFTAIGVVVAAIVGGFFALRNQNRQAAQERLLKAVELIMSSRNGYQADMRKQNLSVFLDNTTQQHLQDIRTKFSGPEFTDIHLALAQSMSEKATSPEEVIAIWKCVLKDKNFLNKITYPEIQDQQT